MSPLAPLMLIVVPATLIAWWRRPGHVVVWATLPYIAMLSLTAHKESRFLFPLAPLLPFLLMFALAETPDRERGAVEKLRWLASGIRLKLLAACSVAGLLLGLWLPTLGDFPIYRRIERGAGATQRPMDVVTLRGERRRPFWRDSGHMGFIEPKNLLWTTNPSVAELDDLRYRSNGFTPWSIRSPARLSRLPGSPSTAFLRAHPGRNGCWLTTGSNGRTGCNGGICTSAKALDLALTATGRGLARLDRLPRRDDFERACAAHGCVDRQPFERG
jgi:hypothetical protein